MNLPTRTHGNGATLLSQRVLLPLLLGLIPILAMSCLEGLEGGPLSVAVGSTDDLSSMSFAVIEGGPNPSPLPVTLSNPGDCDLDFTIEVTTTDGADWLGVDPTAGIVGAGEAVGLDVSIDVMGPSLTPKTWTGSLVIVGYCDVGLRPAIGSPSTISVNLTVTPLADTYTVGGTVTGLTGEGLLLQNNGADLLGIESDGPFAFPAVDGSAYDITVAQQPTGQTCHVINGTGTVVGADVDDVLVQ